MITLDKEVEVLRYEVKRLQDAILKLGNLLMRAAGELDKHDGRIVELEELTTKLKRRRCGCCNSEACEYE